MSPLEIAIQHLHAGRAADALLACRQLIAANERDHGAWHIQAVAQRLQNDVRGGERSVRKAIELDPDRPEYLNTLGLLLNDQGRHDEAADALRRSIALYPNLAQVHLNLARALEKRHVDEALEHYQTTLRLHPNHPDALYELGELLKSIGRVNEAIAYFRSALAARPDSAGIHDALIYAMHFDIDHDVAAIHAEHARWRQAFEEPLRASRPKHENDLSPDRTLRIGYVSPNFFAQAEAFFVVPLLEAHDRSSFEIYCYSDVTHPDEITDRLRSGSHHWRDTRNMRDELLAAQIHMDGIDILVDLTMHMRRSRLRAFAQKPAPVQVCWLAYPGDVAPAAIEYRISDEFLDPVDPDLSVSMQQPVRLPLWFSYDPLGDAGPVAPLPALQRGHITFGALNDQAKLNDQVLSLWADVMRAVPNSRLLAQHFAGSPRKHFADFFAARGVSPDRIEFASLMPRDEYLHLYDRIDIALDTFPYNGITTTCDAMWMGVPVLTPPGHVPQSRAALGLLTVVGLADFAVRNREAFIEASVRWANDLPALAALRGTLRQRMQSSPLMNHKQFARHMEAAYRTTWRNYVARAPRP
jgi:predicted O-linked N-acetylglucosamine transferase (SPINDLY family)